MVNQEKTIVLLEERIKLLEQIIVKQEEYILGLKGHIHINKEVSIQKERVMLEVIKDSSILTLRTKLKTILNN